MEQWVTAVEDAAEIALEQAKSKKDVTTIFTKNRVIFDRFKADAPDAYEALMGKFKTAKESFKE